MRWIERKFPQVFITGFILLVLFPPPLTWGVKKLFLVDGWVALAALTGYALSMAHPRRRTSWVLWFGTALFALIFWHGQFRPSLKESLDYALTYARDNDGFRPFDLVQDGILWVRFTTWLGAACALCLTAPTAFKNREDALGFVGSLWAKAAIFEGLFAVFAFHSPWRKAIGIIYGYDTEYVAWANRLYGTLTSPIELSAVLASGALWWLAEIQQTPREKQKAKRWALAACFLSLVHTQTYTALVAFLVGASLVARHWLRPRLKGLAITLASAAVILTYVSFHAKEWAAKYPWFFILRFHDKSGNLLFRLKPWAIFLNTVFSRADFALLGLGFARSHSDNSFMQFLRAGGLTLLILMVALIGNHLWALVPRKKAELQSPAVEWALASALCILLSALTTDVLIFRAAGLYFFWAVALNLAFRRAPK